MRKLTTEELIQAFWSKVDKNGPPPSDDTLAKGLGLCWLWTGSVSTNGYPRFYEGNATYSKGAHRFSYELHHGPIPEGFHVDHLCKVTICVNPSHLEAVSPTTNILRSNAFSAVNARKTHCPHGHEYTPENTHITVKGSRSCRACARIRFHKRKTRVFAAPSEQSEP